MRELLSKVAGKCRRTLADRLHRRMLPLGSSGPIISFSFDDAPRTAFKTAGCMLSSRGAKATFFVSLGLLGAETEVGTVASPDDLRRAVTEGHELGCHTFDHLDAWQTSTGTFMESVARNRQALDRILPGVTLPVFAYPKSGARFALKRPLEKRFLCCRGGGQVANVGLADLNLLKACFLDRRTGVDATFVKRLIDHTVSTRGWLILAAHDVTANPSPYGCTPELFEDVVDYATRSRALILPVAAACRHLMDGAVTARFPD